MNSMSSNNTRKEAILRLERVFAAPPTQDIAGLSDVSFTIDAGSLLIIRPLPHTGACALPDLCEGLLRPDSGCVRFMGQDWQNMPSRQQDSMRGQIGRVFYRPGFVSNLSVLNNVVLAQLHHTSRSSVDIMKEANELAGIAGMNALPEGRPAWCKRQDLRRAEWVRAFLGAPALALLERPEEGVNPEYVQHLVAIIKRALEFGSAVLVITENQTIWSSVNWSAKTQRLSMEGRNNLWTLNSSSGM